MSQHAVNVLFLCFANIITCSGLLDGSVGDKGKDSNCRFFAVSCCELL